MLALGKLGGGELNFSSDVDLVYLYAPTTTAAGRDAAPARERVRGGLARRSPRRWPTSTAEGHVYRVDLRLRPEGRAGACRPFAARACDEYYATRGATWERLALLKARPVAGDRALGRALPGARAPFVYGRPFDEAALGEVRGIKQPDRPQARGARRERRHVKLGIGGIREIELVVQALQVRHGARRPRAARARHAERSSALRERAAAGRRRAPTRSRGLRVPARRREQAPDGRRHADPRAARATPGSCALLARAAGLPRRGRRRGGGRAARATTARTPRPCTRVFERSFAAGGCAQRSA